MSFVSCAGGRMAWPLNAPSYSLAFRTSQDYDSPAGGAPNRIAFGERSPRKKRQAQLLQVKLSGGEVMLRTPGPAHGWQQSTRCGVAVTYLFHTLSFPDSQRLAIGTSECRGWRAASNVAGTTARTDGLSFSVKPLEQTTGAAPMKRSCVVTYIWPLLSAPTSGTAHPLFLSRVSVLAPATPRGSVCYCTWGRPHGGSELFSANQQRCHPECSFLSRAPSTCLRAHVSRPLPGGPSPQSDQASAYSDPFFLFFSGRGPPVVLASGAATGTSKSTVDSSDSDSSSRESPEEPLPKQARVEDEPSPPRPGEALSLVELLARSSHRPHALLGSLSEGPFASAMEALQQAYAKRKNSGETVLPTSTRCRIGGSRSVLAPVAVPWQADHPYRRNCFSRIC